MKLVVNMILRNLMKATFLVINNNRTIKREIFISASVIYIFEPFNRKKPKYFLFAQPKTK